MLNNRGQVLVFFVLLIPILLIVLVLVIDIGNISYQKNYMRSVCDLTIDYVMEESNIDKIKAFVEMNDDEIDDVKIDGDNLILYKEVDGLLSHIIDIDSFDLEVSCKIERNS